MKNNTPDDSFKTSALVSAIEHDIEKPRKSSYSIVSQFEKKPFSFLHYQSKKTLWIAFRLMLALWAVEGLANIFYFHNFWKVAHALSICCFALSIIAFVASFFQKVKENMAMILMFWSSVCTVYHLCSFSSNINEETQMQSRFAKDLVILFLLPLWGGVFALPLAFLWGQQLVTCATLVGLALYPKSSCQHELCSVHVFVTLMCMSMTFCLQDTTMLLSETACRVQQQAVRSSIFLHTKIDQKELQVQSERDMALFISHEVRNPLFNISNALDFFNESLVTLGKLERIEDLPPLLKTMNGYTADIKVGVEHCTHLLTNILNLSKIEQGKMEWQEKPIHLVQLCNNVMALTRYMAQEYIELRVECPPDLWILADEQLLSQVLVNLVANALKFTTRGFVLLRVTMESFLTNESGFLSDDDQQLSLTLRPVSSSNKLPGTSPKRSPGTLSHAGSSMNSTSHSNSLSLSQDHHTHHGSSRFPKGGMPGLKGTQNKQAGQQTTLVRRCSSTSQSSVEHTPTPNDSLRFPRIHLASPRVLSQATHIMKKINASFKVSSLNDCRNHKQTKFVFEICDTGPGISEEKQGLLFQRFQQAGSHFGTGLGLMLSQKIVELRGGKIKLTSPIWVHGDSMTTHNGSKFAFSLPLQEFNPCTSDAKNMDQKRTCEVMVDRLASGVLSPSTELEQLKGLRVLIVDDSNLNLKQLHHKLTRQSPFEQLQWNCEAVQCGQQAVNLFEESLMPLVPKVCAKSGSFRELDDSWARKASFCSSVRNKRPPPFRIVVVDSELDRDAGQFSDGREVIKIFREIEKEAMVRGENFQRTLIISYSGHIEDDHRRSALEAGADLVWTKPLPAPKQMLQDILQQSPWLTAESQTLCQTKARNFLVSPRNDDSLKTSRTEVGISLLKKSKIVCDDSEQSNLTKKEKSASNCRSSATLLPKPCMEDLRQQLK